MRTGIGIGYPIICPVRYASSHSSRIPPCTANCHKKGQLDARRPLPATVVKRLHEQLTIEWIYNSNAIEGSTLTLRETQLILQHGVTIGGKSLREHFEVINHREAIIFGEALAKKGQPLTPFQVRQLHQLLLMRIDDENAGQYRRTNMRIGGPAHIPPEAWLVPSKWKNGRAGSILMRQSCTRLTALP